MKEAPGSRPIDSLAAQAAAGDARAFTRLWDTHVEALKAYLHGLLRNLDDFYIDDICVDESARGQQVGRAIYEHIIAFAKESGCYNVLLNVWSCNPGAMSFYEKLGLRPYKVGMEKIL